MARPRSGSRASSEAGARVVDLSADLRPGNGCEGIAYGLTELNRVADRRRRTSSPTRAAIRRRSSSRSRRSFERGLVAPGATIVANSASGVTGAGNSPKRELLFGEVTEDYRAYGIGNTHRHLNEMRATLGALERGRRSRLHAASPAGRARHSVDDHGSAHRAARRRARAVARRVSASEPFIEIVDGHAVAAATSRIGTSCASRRRRSPDTRTPTLLVTSAIDNLVKGAAGQARAEREPHARSRRDRGVAAMTRVIKIGGRPQTDPSLARRARVGLGADERRPRARARRRRRSVSTLQAALGGSTKFVNGRRVTTEKDIDIVRMALSGSANKRLVAALVEHGIEAVGLSGEDAALIARDADRSRAARLRRRAVDDQLGVPAAPAVAAATCR